MARATEDVKYRGRLRWNGSHGRVWWDGLLLCEISKFQAKVTADREDVLIGNSKDSKIVSLSGEGSFTIKSVINRNINQYLEEWKAGHDPHANIVGLIDDPDAVDGQKERCSIDNVWFKGTFYNSMMKKTLNYLFYLQRVLEVIDFLYETSYNDGKANPEYFCKN